MTRRLFPESDGRSSIHNCRRIIYSLREFHKDGELIPHDDVDYIIKNELGFLTWRTRREFIERLVDLQYLNPLGKRKNAVTTRIPTRRGFRTYVRKGCWKAYTFGIKAPRRYAETLNPKYIPPNPPSSREMKRSEENGGQRRICALRDDKRDEADSDVETGKKGETGRTEERGEREAQCIHIVDTPVTQERGNADSALSQENKPNNRLSEPVTAVASEETVFIIDYDMPEKPSSNRVAFYRHLSKLKQKFGYEGQSSASVLKTTNRELALEIHRLALSYGGRASVWQAVRFTKHPGEG